MQQRCRPLAFVLAAFALAMQALVPTGYMLGKDTRNLGISITLCTGSGDIVAYLDADGGIVETTSSPEQPSHDRDEDKSPCGFSAQSTAAYDPTIPVTEPQSFPSLIVKPLFLVAFAMPGRGLAAPPPPKTGPPRQV